MRLQTSTSRRVGNKTYTKNQIVIPNGLVTQLRWNPGDQLGARITANRLLVYKVEAKQNIKPSYEQFREAVTSVLRVVPQGCPWSDVRVKAALRQRTPSPVWVRRMEDEKKLERIRNSTSQVIWKLPEEELKDRSKLNGWTQ